MRVLLLTTDSYGGHGGIAYHNRCMAEALAEMPEVTEVIVVPRVQRFAVPQTPAKIRFLHQASGSKARYLRTVTSLALQHFDLVICGHINLLPLAAPFALAKRVPLMLQVYGIDVWQPAKLSTRLWLRHVDAIHSISVITRDRMNGWAHLPLGLYHIIPCTVHLDRFQVGARREELVLRHGLAGRKVIMTLARLAGYERYKGIDEILEVMPDLLRSDDRLMYLVVGDGDDQGRLQAKASALGIADNVVFTGFIDEEEKPDYLRLADVFVLPGRGEGFGIVYLEAMASGVPVVASLLDGSREAVRDGELGVLVDPSDLASVREGVKLALSKEKGVPEGLTFFAWPAFAQRVSVAIRSIS
jgi:phosphatidyl-myo-inositol dimannoside synthase